MDNTLIKHKTITNMRLFGGGFVKALGEAYAKADSSNALRLEQAFPEYFKTYGPCGEFEKANTHPSPQT